MNPKQIQLYRRALHDITCFAAQAPGFHLRAYQQGAAQSILEALLERRGGTLAVMFPRQSGKNTLQAVLEAYLLWRCQFSITEMVKISPTWKPQSQNAMRRLQTVLETNRLTRRIWRKESGYIYRIGRARIVFLSGAPEANIVGATASLLVQVDEAQDVQIAKYDKDIAPMAASTNALRLFWGTAWTSDTLLGRELRAARLAQAQDGKARAFVLTAEDVGREVPAYAEYVASQVLRLGRQHPLVKTQFYCEEIDATGVLFDTARLALLQGAQPPRYDPQPGGVYALLLDVAGEDEEAAMSGLSTLPGSARRDSTALSVVEVDISAVSEGLPAAPVYRVLSRREWVGERHSALFAQIKALAEHWQARCVVVDATGVGAGLASFLAAHLPCRVVPFTFTAQSKSRLGWNFISLIETGRFKEYTPAQADEMHAVLHARFIRQLACVRHDVSPAEGRLLRWSVPDGLRDPLSGEPVHDDLVICAALCTVLDELSWGSAESHVIRPPDPLEWMRPVY